MDALKGVTNLAKFVNSGAYNRKRYCLLVALDIRNAFNSAPWRRITKALQDKEISQQLVTKAYLSERYLEVGESSELKITSGVS